MGYGADEIIGQHHALFVEKSYAASDAYQQFWKGLAAGKAQVAEVERKTKSRQQVFLSAVYHPVKDSTGKVVRVIKIASDISQQKKAFDTIEEQNQALKEMSTPISSIWDHILFLPLVGFVDSKRANDLMMTMFSHITTHQAKVFILDISGIAVMDTAVANHLIKMTQGAKLMGCTCIVAGLSAAVAQTIVELGVDVHQIRTTGSLRDAIAQAFQLSNQDLSKLR